MTGAANLTEPSNYGAAAAEQQEAHSQNDNPVPDAH